MFGWVRRPFVPRVGATLAAILVLVASCAGAEQGHAQAVPFVSNLGDTVIHECVDAHGKVDAAGTSDRLTIVAWNRNLGREDHVRIETAADTKDAAMATLIQDQTLAKRKKDRSGHVGDLSKKDKANNPGSYTSATYTMGPAEKTRRVFVRDLTPKLGKDENVQGELENNACAPSADSGGSTSEKAKWTAICREQTHNNAKWGADCRKKHHVPA